MSTVVCRGAFGAITTRVLSEARAIRDAFPDLGAMGKLPVSPLAPTDDGVTGGHLAILGDLRDEMLMVRDGRAEDLLVLDNEIACLEEFLACTSA